MKGFIGAIMAGALLLFSAAPTAAKTAEEYSKERSASMKAMDSALNEISQRVGGLFAFDKKVIREKVEIVRDNLNGMKALFPEGSATSQTLPEIWTEPEEFDEEIEEILERVEKLSRELETADRKRAKSLYKKLHRACTGCHHEFRK